MGVTNDTTFANSDISQDGRKSLAIFNAVPNLEERPFKGVSQEEGDGVRGDRKGREFSFHADALISSLKALVQ
jgi:hypothetical protein